MRDHLATTRRILADQLGITIEEDINPSDHILEDLGADSLDTVELVMAFEEEYDINVPDEEADNLTKVSDIVTYLERRFPSENNPDQVSEG
jgi:acyl carrier protein